MKRKITKKGKQPKVISVPEPKLSLSPPPVQTSKTNFKWAFDLETIKAWKASAKKA